MSSQSEKLKPTLWRTCRVLANRTRLRILGEVFRCPARNVSLLARRLDLPLPVASRYLRELNARGLLRAERSGKWVCYRACADKSVWGAGPLLKALRRSFTGEKQPVGVIYRNVTAFTHPRRIAIVKELGPIELTMTSLRMRTGLCHRVLTRHLKKLADRGFVLIDENRCRCASPDGPLAKTLLKLACGE